MMPNLFKVSKFFSIILMVREQALFDDFRIGLM